MLYSAKMYDTCIVCTQCIRACPADVLEMIPWIGKFTSLTTYTVVGSWCNVCKTSGDLGLPEGDSLYCSETRTSVVTNTCKNYSCNFFLFDTFGKLSL